MPLTVEQGKALITTFCASYPVAYQIQYRVRLTQEELYGPQASQPSFGKIFGGYVPGDGGLQRGRCDFATANIRDENEFKQTLRHEVLGHFGINTFTAEEKRAILSAIVKARNQPGLSELWAKVDQHYDQVPESVKAEEVFAFACETIAPEHMISTGRGEQSLREVCTDPARTMQLRDLINITSMVAEGMRDRTRSQQIFPSTNQQLRKGLMANQATHAFYSVGSTRAPQRMPITAINAEIGRLRKQWASMPAVTVVKTVDDLPFEAPANADGAYFDKHVYVVTENIADVKQLQKVMAHECVMHHGLEEMLGNYGFSKLHHGIQKLKKNGDPIIGTLAKEILSRYGDLPVETETKEIVARAGEQCLDDRGNVRVEYGFMKSVYAGVAGWLRDHGITVPFTNMELHGIMHNANEWVSKSRSGQETPPRGELGGSVLNSIAGTGSVIDQVNTYPELEGWISLKADEHRQSMDSAKLSPLDQYLRAAGEIENPMMKAQMNLSSIGLQESNLVDQLDIPNGKQSVMKEGTYIGKVLDIAGGIVTQKVNRAGDPVRHLFSKLSSGVEIGEVVEIQYKNGRGDVIGAAVGVERGR